MKEWFLTFKEAFEAVLIKTKLDFCFETSKAFLIKAFAFLWENFLEFLKNPKIPFWGEILSLIFSFLFFLLASIYFWKLKILPSKIETLIDFLKPSFSEKKRKKLKEWKKIKKLFERGASSDLKLAIIEADKLLDEVLSSLGFSQKTLKEKLDLLSKEEFPELDELKYAHFIRNKIVHQKDFSLSKKEAEVILSIYENFFRSLDLID